MFTRNYIYPRFYFVLIILIDARKYIIKNFSPPRRYLISNSHLIGSVIRSCKTGALRSGVKNSMRKVSLPANTTVTTTTTSDKV